MLLCTSLVDQEEMPRFLASPKCSTSGKSERVDQVTRYLRADGAIRRTMCRECLVSVKKQRKSLIAKFGSVEDLLANTKELKGKQKERN